MEKLINGIPLNNQSAESADYRCTIYEVCRSFTNMIASLFMVIIITGSVGVKMPTSKTADNTAPYTE